MPTKFINKTLKSYFMLAKAVNMCYIFDGIICSTYYMTEYLQLNMYKVIFLALDTQNASCLN